MEPGGEDCGEVLFGRENLLMAPTMRVMVTLRAIASGTGCPNVHRWSLRSLRHSTFTPRHRAKKASEPTKEDHRRQSTAKPKCQSPPAS